MATNFTIRTSIVKASSGKCAVAAAAYQAAEQLYDERLGMTFSYRVKEEVVYTEILLPRNAPMDYQNREKLWNAVEASQNKANSRFARQFVIAVPNEWSREEVIERSREYLQKTFADKGLIVDFAYHEKSGNHHLHVLCPVRAIGENGQWMAMEKKVYALDEQGNKIPEIDEVTGEQKVRVRNRNGRESRELLWQRITVQNNPWNTKEKLQELKKEWAEFCNQYLTQENRMDYRSYAERGIIDRIPEVHEGAKAREAEKRGIQTWQKRENEERRELNSFFEKSREFFEKAKNALDDFKEKIAEWRALHDEKRSIGEEGFVAGIVRTVVRISTVDAGTFCRSAGVGTAGAKISEYGNRMGGLATGFLEVTSRAYEYTKRECEHESNAQRIKIRR